MTTTKTPRILPRVASVLHSTGVGIDREVREFFDAEPRRSQCRGGEHMTHSIADLMLIA